MPDNFIWLRLGSDALSVTAGILLFMGAIFGVVGFALTISLVAIFVGLPFLGLGLFFLLFAVPTLINRYQNARQTEEILRNGQAALGQVENLRVNYSVAITTSTPGSSTTPTGCTGKASAAA